MGSQEVNCRSFVYQHFGIIKFEEHSKLLEYVSLRDLLTHFAEVKDLSITPALAIVRMIEETGWEKYSQVTHMALIDPITLKITHRKGINEPITYNEDMDHGLKDYLLQSNDKKIFIRPR